MVAELASRVGLHHQPTLYYVPSAAPNSFCVGHGADAALAVTDGLLRRLKRREVAGCWRTRWAIYAPATPP